MINLHEEGCFAVSVDPFTWSPLLSLRSAVKILYSYTPDHHDQDMHESLPADSRMMRSTEKINVGMESQLDNGMCIWNSTTGVWTKVPLTAELEMARINDHT